ncbi:Coenzyme F420 hydrogenase/dehydrogenase, beta subunit C-terminal domain [Ruminococcus sp.]|uniref:Coenzyme F420 hydrogenase/dehydrogenase, beta subunit C-terminal domain n=1 Tax=Ruminococcus sp. TaxID=41978 RepID=UPI0025EC1B41|nr:Coenzyme F420 hydrogenase/dehydrogenase, beta subunit C-terminal domain [Ruminococcus sp.]
MIEINDKSQCTGCAACANVCPSNCISMFQDDEGFYYPVVDSEKCIHCELCIKTCPVINRRTPESETRKVYICQNVDLKIRKDSTSGGVFSALSKYVLDRNGVVFGAEFDRNSIVRHGMCDNTAGLKRFRGSKYVQSFIGSSYKLVKDELNKDRWVLFTGTPCQIEGLHSYLGKEYKKLILMDIVCYSISSPGVWRQFLDYVGKNIPLDKVSCIKFRDKSKYGYEYTLMTFRDKEGKTIYSSGPESNPMLRSFVSNTSTRPSCYACKFKTIDRVSDYTAWDCYNVYKYNKNLDDNLGTSHLMVHSSKGLEILKTLKREMSLYQVNAEEAVASEPAMTQCAVPSDMRKPFFKMYRSGNNVFTRFFQDTKRVKVERLLRSVLSRIGLYKYIKRLMKG